MMKLTQMQCKLLSELNKELKGSMLEGDWDKAIDIAKRIDGILPSSMFNALCKSYNEETRECSERLSFSFFPGKYITIPCPFYGEKCRINGDIGLYTTEPNHEDLVNKSRTMKEYYSNLSKLK